MPNSNPDIPRSRIGGAGTTVHRAKFDSEDDAARASELLANPLFYRLKRCTAVAAFVARDRIVDGRGSLLV